MIIPSTGEPIPLDALAKKGEPLFTHLRFKNSQGCLTKYLRILFESSVKGFFEYI